MYPGDLGGGKHGPELTHEVSEQRTEICINRPMNVDDLVVALNKRIPRNRIGVHGDPTLGPVLESDSI